MCTCSSKLPSGSGRTWTASSKSRAVSPSMVTIGRSRKSRRAAEIVFGDLLRRGFRVGEDFFREFVRQMVLANDDFDVDADIAGAAENFDHAAHRREAAARKARDFDVHDRAIEFGKAQAAIRGRAAAPRGRVSARSSGVSSSPGGIRTSCWRRDVVGQDVIAVRAVAEKADDGRMLAHDDLHDAAFGASIGAAAVDAALGRGRRAWRRRGYRGR